MTYHELRISQCPHCAAGVPLDERRVFQHIIGYTDYSSFNAPNKWTPCLADSAAHAFEKRDAEVVELKARIAEMDKFRAALVSALAFDKPSELVTDELLLDRAKDSRDLAEEQLKEEVEAKIEEIKTCLSPLLEDIESLDWLHRNRYSAIYDHKSCTYKITFKTSEGEFTSDCKCLRTVISEAKNFVFYF